MNIETRNKIKHSLKEKINSNHLVHYGYGDDQCC